MTLLQAKSEPTGKRVPDRRDGDSKKEKASTSDRYSCRALPCTIWWVSCIPMSWACSEACGSLDPRSANLKREEKGERKDDAKKTDDGSTEKSKDADDQKPGPSERSRTTKSGRP